MHPLHDSRGSEARSRTARMSKRLCHEITSPFAACNHSLWSRLCNGFRAATSGSGYTGYFVTRPNDVVFNSKESFVSDRRTRRALLAMLPAFLMICGPAFG